MNYNLKRYIEKRRAEEIMKIEGYEGFNEEDEKNGRDRNSIISELESNSNESILK